MKRIEHLPESPCYKCGLRDECNNKVHRSPVLAEIVDSQFGDSDLDFHECPIWISLTAPEMIDES